MNHFIVLKTFLLKCLFLCIACKLRLSWANAVNTRFKSDEFHHLLSLAKYIQNHRTVTSMVSRFYPEKCNIQLSHLCNWLFSTETVRLRMEQDKLSHAPAATAEGI